MIEQGKAMKAARLNLDATRLVIEDIEEPHLRPGSVVVKIHAVFMPAFMNKVVDASGGYTTPKRPFTPGMDGIGSIEAVAPHIRGLEPGMRVYCDNFYRPMHPARTGERAFLGNFAVGPGAEYLLAEWPDGLLAEKVCLPADCVVPITQNRDVSDGVLSRIGWLGTAYGGWRKIAFPPGAVVAVNGASGLLGSSAVLVALALGASRVFAVGHREESLQALAATDPRITPVTTLDSVEMLDAALSSVDGADNEAILGLLAKLRRGGSMVFVGATKSPLPVPLRLMVGNDITLRGSLWFERDQVGELLRLGEAGLLNLRALATDDFPLAKVNEALVRSKELANPLRHVSVTCNT
jgi:D-arabinose 1-dehydrogenase-like Zn-dependent alcohol dehydrogenase